jgi:hypothetical protein
MSRVLVAKRGEQMMYGGPFGLSANRFNDTVKISLICSSAAIPAVRPNSGSGSHYYRRNPKLPGRGTA